MSQKSRREFLGDVGRGMFVAGLGSGMAAEFGLSPAFGLDEVKKSSLTFGRLEPLVCLMQETPVARLQGLLVDKLSSNQTNLAELVSAAALANARTFGGEDYVGYHCEMALTPALEMASRLPTERQPLPVLKVLYRNTAQLQNVGGRKREVLKPLTASTPVADSSSGENSGDALREAVRSRDMNRAEAVFAGVAQQPADRAYADLQATVLDDASVHRVVLAHRSWRLVELVGAEHAHTILRQCVHYCVQEEQEAAKRNRPIAMRPVVAKAFEQHKLDTITVGNRIPDDAWIAGTADALFRASKSDAVMIVAQAIAEGFDPDSIGEAIAIAANALILRHEKEGSRGPLVHGASTGVHAADATNAWRHIARQCGGRQAIGSLLAAAYFVANGGAMKQEPFPHRDHLQKVAATDAAALLGELDEAIRGGDQARAAAVTHRYGELGFESNDLFDRLLRPAVSEDGRLHNEKYFCTALDEFTRGRTPFRWRHAIALSRVLASSYGRDMEDKPGFRAPGYEEACQLLRVPV